MRSLRSNLPYQACSARILRIATALCLFALLILGHPLPAAEEGIQVFRGKREVPEMGTFPEYVITTPASRVGVLPPQNATAEIGPQAGRLKFLLSGYTGAIVLELNTTNRSGPATIEHQTGLLQLVQHRFPDATVRAAGVAYVGSGKGLAFDVERTTAYKTKLTTRLAFMSIPDGMLEMSMTASENNFPNLERTFATFLSYVQIQPATQAGG